MVLGNYFKKLLGMDIPIMSIDPFSMAALAAVIGGGASYLGGKLSKPKKTNISPEFQAYKDLGHVPTGQQQIDLNERMLNEAMSPGKWGKYVGFDPGYVSRTTNPYAANRMAYLQDEEIPGAEQGYSGRGLSRSSMAQRDIGKLRAGAGRDISQAIAEAYKQNLLQQKTDVQNIQNQSRASSALDANIRQGAAQQELARATGQAQYDQADNLYDSQNVDRSIAAGASLFGGTYGAINDATWKNKQLELLRNALNQGKTGPFGLQMGSIRKAGGAANYGFKQTPQQYNPAVFL